LYVAVQAASQGVATLAAGVIGFALASVLSPAELDRWGWRAAFLLGAAVVPVGLYLRSRLPETLVRHEPASAGVAGAALAGAALAGGRAAVGRALLCLLMLGAMTITTYVIGYLVTYAQDTLKLDAHRAFAAIIAQGVGVLCFSPLGGMLSDRFGRKPIMLSGIGALLLMVIPGFVALNAWPGAALLFATSLLLSATLQLLFAPLMAAVAESLPAGVRSGGIAVLYAGAIALFGGTTQFAIKALAVATSSPLAPAWYLTGALCVGGLAVLAFPESNPRVRPR
jgi:MFS family permease